MYWCKREGFRAVGEHVQAAIRVEGKAASIKYATAAAAAAIE